MEELWVNTHRLIATGWISAFSAAEVSHVVACARHCSKIDILNIKKRNIRLFRRLKARFLPEKIWVSLHLTWPNSPATFRFETLSNFGKNLHFFRKIGQFRDKLYQVTEENAIFAKFFCHFCFNHDLPQTKT